MNEKAKRLFHLDLAKVFAVFFMVFIHIFEEIPYEGLATDAFPMYEMKVFFGIIYNLCPTVFMFCLGCGIVLNKNTTPKNLVRRGIFLLVLEVLLNFFRYFIPHFLGFLVRGDMYGDWLNEFLKSFFYSDILTFAGFTFLLFALFKKLKLRPGIIGLIAVVTTVIALIIPPLPDSSSTVLNAILGNFFYTNEYSFFPIITWIVYPVAGYHYQYFMSRVKNIDKYHLTCFMASTITAITAIGVMKMFDIYDPKYVLWGEFGTKMNIPNLTLVVPIVVSWISFMYIISKWIKNINFIKFITNISVNTTVIYCIHWFFIMLWLLVMMGFEIKLSTVHTIFILGLNFYIVSALLAKLVRKWINHFGDNKPKALIKNL